MLNVAHFVSGGGTTMAHVAHLANKGDLGDIRSTLVIASKPGIGAIEKAQKLGIPTLVVNPKDATEMLQVLTSHNIDVIINNGWIPLTPIEVVKVYSQDGKQGYNQHPASLRADRIDFGGKGMWGARPTAAKVFYSLASRGLHQYAFTESSVHRLTEKLDDGELVGARVLDITQDLDRYQAEHGGLEEGRDITLTPALQRLISGEKDTQGTLVYPGIQGKLLTLEHETVADVMRILGEGRIPTLHPIYDTHLSLDIVRLDWAREQAIRLYPDG